MTERPREVRQLALLRDWLEEQILSAREAACLFAGVLPSARMGGSGDFGGWLPGREPWEHAKEAWAFRVNSEISHIETILRESGLPAGQSPQDYLSAGVKLGFVPPWLDVVRMDTVCQSLLPSELQETPPVDRPIQTANRKKAQKRWNDDDKQALMRGAGREEFERLRAKRFEGYTGKDGTPVIIRVAVAVLEAIRKVEPRPEFHPSTRTAERRVKEWLSEDQPDNAGAMSDNAGACMAK